MDYDAFWSLSPAESDARVGTLVCLDTVQSCFRKFQPQMFKKKPGVNGSPYLLEDTLQQASHVRLQHELGKRGL